MVKDQESVGELAVFIQPVIRVLVPGPLHPHWSRFPDPALGGHQVTYCLLFYLCSTACYCAFRIVL